MIKQQKKIIKKLKILKKEIINATNLDHVDHWPHSGEQGHSLSSSLSVTLAIAWPWALKFVCCKMHPTFHNENILRLTLVDNFATVFERCPGSFGSFFGRISCWLFRNFPMMSIQTMWQSKDNFPDPNQSHSSWKARFPNYCMSRKLTQVLIDA